MIETTGTVTEVCIFSRLEDQISILVLIHSINGEKGGCRSLDWVVPKGTAKVGTTVKVTFIENV